MNAATLTDNLVAACDQSIAQIDAALAEMDRQNAASVALHNEFRERMARLDAEMAGWGA